MKFYRLQGKCFSFRKFESCQTGSLGIIRFWFSVIFLLSLTLILLQNSAKRWEIHSHWLLQLLDLELGIYCSNIYGKISAILSSVLEVWDTDSQKSFDFLLNLNICSYVSICLCILSVYY